MPGPGAIPTRNFRRLLPQSSGPWLALSGGGADGAFGAGVMIGWDGLRQPAEFRWYPALASAR